MQTLRGLKEDTTHLTLALGRNGDEGTTRRAPWSRGSKSWQRQRFLVEFRRRCRVYGRGLRGRDQLQQPLKCNQQVAVQGCPENVVLCSNDTCGTLADFVFLPRYDIIGVEEPREAGSQAFLTAFVYWNELGKRFTYLVGLHAVRACRVCRNDVDSVCVR